MKRNDYVIIDNKQIICNGLRHSCEDCIHRYYEKKRCNKISIKYLIEHYPYQTISIPASCPLIKDIEKGKKEKVVFT